MDRGGAARGRLAETVAMYLLMASYAVSTTIIGAILPRLMAEFGIPLSKGGIFVAVLNIGCFGGILASGLLVDRYAKRVLIIASYACFLVALFAAGCTSSLATYLCMVFLEGVASKFMDASLNAGVSQIHTENRGFYLGLLHGSYAVGSFSGPLFVGMLVGGGLPWRHVYIGIAALGLAFVAAYSWLTRSGGAKAGTGSSPAASPASWKSVLCPRMVFLWLILFFYCGHEIGLNNWLPTHMVRSAGSSEVVAASGVSAFWLGLILSRLTCSVLSRRVYEGKLLVYGAAAGGVLLVLGVAVGGETMLFVASASAGLFAGGTIPMVMTLGFSWNPAAQGRAAMMLFIAITGGSVVFPWLMGIVAHAAGLRASMLFNGFMLLTVCAFALCLPKENRNREA